VYDVHASAEEKPLSEFKWPINDRVTITPDVDYLFLVRVIFSLYCSLHFLFGYSLSGQNKQFWL
jgi:hypothetical protein